MSYRYNIGRATARELGKLAKDDHDRAAITRLEDFRGTAADLERCAELYEEAGLVAVARMLRGTL